jgi:hypothetical protein
VCKDPPRFVYYVGINQTINIECRISNANPLRITYEWNLDNFNINTRFSNGNQNMLTESDNNNEVNNNNIETNIPTAQRMLNANGQLVDPQNENIISNQISSQSFNQFNSNSKMSQMINDGLTSRFKWRPTSINDFGQVKCKATNEVGSTDCLYEIRLGGVPNPPTECNHVLKNTSAIISCQVGFHQGDPDIYCYLLRKSENGVYKEHTRNRESCSFIVNDVNVNKLNEFWIYSSNKHGHNKDNGVYLTIGQHVKRKNFDFYMIIKLFNILRKKYIIFNLQRLSRLIIEQWL